LKKADAGRLSPGGHSSPGWCGIYYPCASHFVRRIVTLAAAKQLEVREPVRVAPQSTRRRGRRSAAATMADTMTMLIDRDRRT
jgi:hypothetical protein